MRWSLYPRESDAIHTSGWVLRAVVHSAGVYSSRRIITEDGVERTIAVNHLAPFLLTHELLAGSGWDAPLRVVVVGSNAHRGATLDPDRLARPRVHLGLRAYGRSKLANVLFVRELARRFDPAEIEAYAVDPGLVDTAIGSKHAGPGSRLVWSLRRRRGTSPDVPARTIAALATGRLGAGASGTYWRDGRRVRPSARALDPDLARAVWRVSCSLCDVTDPQWHDHDAAPAADHCPR